MNNIEKRHNVVDQYKKSEKEVIKRKSECKNLPNVIIFEGGDVCGKTTQSNLLAKNLHFCIKYKFPNKWVCVDHEDLEYFLIYNDEFKQMFDTIVNKLDIYFDDEETKIDIYKVFKCIHNKIYKLSDDELINQITNSTTKYSLIENLIKFDIFVNSYDKYLWLVNDYKTIVDTGETYNHVKVNNIVIDRFMTSGTIYNTNSVILYIQNIIDNNDKYSLEKRQIIYDFIYRIRKFSEFCNCVLKETIREVNLLENIRSFYDILDEEIFYNKIENKLKGAYYSNFYEIYFKPSQLLYNRFMKLGNENLREVSEYDTNIKLKFIIEYAFEDFYNRFLHDRYYFNLIEVPTDILLTKHTNKMDNPEQVFESFINKQFPLNYYLFDGMKFFHMLDEAYLVDRSDILKESTIQ